MIQEDRIRAAVKEILEALGEDTQREGLENTPRRVAQMYRDLFSGVGVDPTEVLTTAFEEDHHDTVILRDIAFYSMCEHHLLPFFGQAHIGYVPNARIVGASKLVRALEVVAQRPQLQERMTAQLADAIYTSLNPKGVAVVLEAQHLCMVMRGVRKQGSSIVTTATRGDFEGSRITQQELLALLYRR